MEQPKGTTTYKGGRKSRPGQESLIDGKDKDKLDKAAKFHADGKKIEAEKSSPKKKIQPEKVDKEGVK